MRGIAPIIAFTILTAAVFILSITTFLWVQSDIQDAYGPVKDANVKNTMIALDFALRNVAKSDVGFTDTVYIRTPDIFLGIYDDQNMIVVSYHRGTYSPPITEEGSFTCCEDCEIIKDAKTGINMRRIPGTNVFASGGPIAEFAVCNPKIDIVFNNTCSVSKTGTGFLIYIKKIGYTENKSIVEMGIC
jgi:hypothetical protein